MVLPPSPKRSRPTHSTAFRTRTGQVVFSPVDRPSVGEGPPPTAYNTSTLPTSHGLLPLSPQAMLSSGGAGTGFGTRRRPCNEPPNVLWMLRGDGASEYRAELEPMPRLASPPIPRQPRSPAPPQSPSSPSQRRLSRGSGEGSFTPRHSARLSGTRFAVAPPGVPPPFAPWGSVSARVSGSPVHTAPSSPRSRKEVCQQQQGPSPDTAASSERSAPRPFSTPAACS